MADVKPLKLDATTHLPAEFTSGDTIDPSFVNLSQHFDGGNASSVYTTAQHTFDGGGASG